MTKYFNLKKLLLGFLASFIFLLFIIGFYHSRRTYFDFNSGKMKNEFSSFGIIYFTDTFSTDFSNILKDEHVLQEKAPHWQFVSGLIQGPFQKYYEDGRFGYSISQLKVLSLYLNESKLPHEERVAIATNVMTEIQNDHFEKIEDVIEQSIRKMQIAESAEDNLTKNVWPEVLLSE